MRILPIIALVASVVFLSGLVAAPVFANTGHASWYGYEMCRKGRACKTANGEHFKPEGHTAAHKTLPFGTKLKVTNLRNGKSVIVRINDRGPFIRGRVLDLSMGAARAIGMGGTAQVRYVVVK